MFVYLSMYILHVDHDGFGLWIMLPHLQALNFAGSLLKSECSVKRLWDFGAPKF